MILLVYLSTYSVTAYFFGVLMAAYTLTQTSHGLMDWTKIQLIITKSALSLAQEQIVKKLPTKLYYYTLQSIYNLVTHW